MRNAAGAVSASRLESGFTLIEVLVAILIIGVLLGIAPAAYQKQVRDSRMSSATNDLVRSLMSAKSESVGRSRFVSVCKRNVAGTACLTSGGWEQGWLIFVDVDGDGSVDAGDEILYMHDALAADITAIGTTEVVSRITYRPNGLTNLSSNQTIVLCDPRGFGADARGVVISILGKASNMLGTDTGQSGCLVSA